MSAGSTIIAPCAFMAAIAASISSIGAGAVAEVPLPRDADAGALQRRRVERGQIVDRRARRRCAWSPRPRIAPGHARRAAPPRPRRVRAIGPAVSWRVRDGDDAGPADQPDRRLDPDEAVRRGRAHDRAVRLGADADRARGWRRPPRRSRSSSRTGCGRATYGFRVCPPRPLQPLVECVERKLAHSLRFVLPRITAPASRSRRHDERVARRRSILRARASRRSSSCDRRCRCCP